MQLTKSLYLLAGGSYGTQGNVYALRHKDGVILIDAGEPGAERTIDQNLQSWGLGELPITHVLLTHAHVDHAGCAAYYRERGAAVVCGEEDAPMLRAGGFLEPTPFEGMDFPPCEADIPLRGDTRLDVNGIPFTSYATPGHSPGSRVYACEAQGQSLLFVGDLASCEGTRGELASLGWTGDPQYHREAFIQSVRRLATFRPDILLGGHGIPCLRDPCRTLRSACAAALLMR